MCIHVRVYIVTLPLVPCFIFFFFFIIFALFNSYFNGEIPVDSEYSFGDEVIIFMSVYSLPSPKDKD